jgi:excisionase family DNA binding protein
MISSATLSTLAQLEREMAGAGRSTEEAALREALHALARPERGFLTTGQAADRLGVSIPTVKRWVERGTLTGALLDSRWYVTLESVEQVLRLRKALAELDLEGDPSGQEIQKLYRRSRQGS